MLQNSDSLESFYLDVLEKLVSQPTAPFREERVAHRIATFLREWGVPFELDEFGNIIAHYQHGTDCRPMVLMAHMDHPAFVITARGGPNGTDFVGKLQGGVSAQCFVQEVAVRLFPSSRPDSEAGLAARIVGFKQGEKPREVEFYLSLDKADAVAAVEPGDFGVWDLPDFELRDNFIHARVIDDLVGCAAALLTLWKLSQEQPDTNVYGVFTRAEEMGLVGATAVLQSGRMPKAAYIVSLEASKTLPGAVQGEGPVIRVGDKIFTFQEEAEIVLRTAAKNLNKGGPAGGPPLFKSQRQLMSGGGCEAGAALLAGYTATGLAFPLGNYHNVTSDFKLEPENIHKADYIAGIVLLQEAVRLMPQADNLRSDLIKAYGDVEPLIEQLKASTTLIKKAVHPTDNTLGLGK